MLGSEAEQLARVEVYDNVSSSLWHGAERGVHCDVHCDGREGWSQGSSQGWRVWSRNLHIIS
jgi:hypothetical protein